MKKEDVPGMAARVSKELPWAHAGLPGDVSVLGSSQKKRCVPGPHKFNKKEKKEKKNMGFERHCFSQKTYYRKQMSCEFPSFRRNSVSDRRPCPVGQVRAIPHLLGCAAAKEKQHRL